jgi:hypothetical protein
MMVFIRALAPPFPCFPFSDPSVRRTPLLCMWLQHKKSDNTTATPVFRQCRIWHFMEGRESKNVCITCNNLTYFTIICEGLLRLTQVHIYHICLNIRQPHIQHSQYSISRKYLHRTCLTLHMITTQCPLYQTINDNKITLILGYVRHYNATLNDCYWMSFLCKMLTKIMNISTNKLPFPSASKYK